MCEFGGGVEHAGECNDKFGAGDGDSADGGGVGRSLISPKGDPSPHANSAVSSSMSKYHTGKNACTEDVGKQTLVVQILKWT